MKVEINSERLLKLENSYRKLIALENGGVDNWEWYSESLEDFEEEEVLTGYGIAKELKYKTGQNVFYQNNEATFVKYLTENIAVISLELLPNFDIDPQGFCWGCNCGDSDNKLSCNCDEISELLEGIEENTKPTVIPLIVNVCLLLEKPMIVAKHEKELQEIKDKKEIEKKKTKEFLDKYIELHAKVNALEEKLKQLEEINNI